jgi:hypothetical protein
LSEAVRGFLLGGQHGAPAWPPVEACDPLVDDDLHLALSLTYELHYRGIAGVDADREWDPSLLGFRRELERPFEVALRRTVGQVRVPTRPEDLSRRLVALSEEGTKPSLSRYLARHATEGQFREFVIHRSIYTLKEADPHSLAIPRIDGPAKAALVEIQADEYGGGDPERMHATIFARTMEALGLDATYGAYLDVVPGVTLATVNLISLFALHRRLRGAAMGHLALFELTSAVPNRRYGNGLRRLGFGAEVTHYYDEHVEADSVHDMIAAYDLAGALMREDPWIGSEILFGALALARMEDLFATHLVEAWEGGRSSLRERALVGAG